MAIDYRTAGKWQQAYPETRGLLVEHASGRADDRRRAVVQSAIRPGNFVAFDAATGKPLWHAALGATLSNTPQTFTLDGRQDVVVAAGESALWLRAAVMPFARRRHE